MDKQTETRTIRELVLGKLEVSNFLRVTLGTVYQWRARKVLPPTEMQVAGADAWYEGTIVDWAKKTGRWKEQLNILTQPSVGDLMVRDGSLIGRVDEIEDITLDVWDGSPSGTTSEIPTTRVHVRWEPSELELSSWLTRDDISDVGGDEQYRVMWEVEPGSASEIVAALVIELRRSLGRP